MGGSTSPSSMAASREQLPERSRVWPRTGSPTPSGTGLRQRRRSATCRTITRRLCGHFTVARGWRAGTWMAMGRLDLLVNAIGERARLFRNVATNRGNWVAVRARGRRTRSGCRGRGGRGPGRRDNARVRWWVRRRVSLGRAGNRALRAGTCRRDRGVRSCVAGRFAQTFPGGGVNRVVTLRKGTGNEDGRDRPGRSP